MAAQRIVMYRKKTNIGKEIRLEEMGQPHIEESGIACSVLL